MNISAIFSDYDGTLAPDDVSLDASRLPKEVEDPLLGLSAHVPVAILTSKDIAFIRPRVPFARAWACVSGLEVVLADGRTFTSSHRGDSLREGLRYVKRHDKFGLSFELKRSTLNDLLAFSVDWRRARPPPAEFIQATVENLTRRELAVTYDPAQPFLDVFGGTPDKGRAVRELKQHLRVSGNVLFLGDSAADNPAFEEADLAVCVAHGQSLGGLGCKFTVRQEGLGSLLRSLLDHHLDLNPRTLELNRPAHDARIS